VEIAAGEREAFWNGLLSLRVDEDIAVVRVPNYREPFRKRLRFEVVHWNLQHAGLVDKSALLVVSN